MSNQNIYNPGSIGLNYGYDLSVMNAAKMQQKSGQPKYPQFKNGATLVQVDLNITNSMATSLQIELFNFFRSQTRLFSAQNQCNDYFPIGIDDSAGWPYNAGNYVDPNLTMASATVVNGYTSGLFQGAYDNYTVAQAALPDDSRNKVFFDIYGNLIYQPGRKAAAQPAGNVVISINQLPYLQLFNFTGVNKIIVDCIKFTYNTEAQQLQMAQTVYHKYFSSTGVATNTENYTPSTFFNEGNFQANIITVPVDKRITDQWGIWYTILGQQGGVNTNATFTMFLWVDNDCLRTNSNPRG